MPLPTLTKEAPFVISIPKSIPNQSNAFPFNLRPAPWRSCDIFLLWKVIEGRQMGGAETSRRRVPSVGLSTGGDLQNCHKRILTLVLKPKKFAGNTNVR